MEEIIFYTLIFIIGTVFGSFFTLAVYRIPLHQDITHERSYCPNCNHRLEFLDMIPILSYLFLGGKCRYCKQKIRIRYLLLEILSGIVFLLFAVSLNFNTLDINKIIYLVFALLYLAGMIIIAGIDKENRTIQKGVTLYELIIINIYMIYLYILQEINVYRYVIYLFVLCMILILDNAYLKKKMKDNYTLQILELGLIIAMFCGTQNFILSAILMLLTIAIENILLHIFNKKKKSKKEKLYKNLKLGYYLIISNIIMMIVMNFIKI